MPSSIIIAGATGLVGLHCLRLALADPDIRHVIVIGRRPLPDALIALDTGGKLEQVVIDFDDLHRHADQLRSDALICALGTTMTKAGSRDRFRRVDHDYPLDLARIAHENGIRHYLLVSALGADASSRWFYNRVKGEVEEAIRRIGLHRLTIVRPSLLLGEREETRVGEMIAQRLGFLIPGKYRPVHAGGVARILVREAKTERPGLRVIESREMRASV